MEVDVLGSQGTQILPEAHIKTSELIQGANYLPCVLIPHEGAVGLVLFCFRLSHTMFSVLVVIRPSDSARSAPPLQGKCHVVPAAATSRLDHAV